MRFKLFLLSAVVAVLLALPASALAAQGSGGQAIAGTVLDTIAVVPVPVTMSGMTPGSSTPASGSGNVVVTSTSCYNLSVSDPTNDGYLQGASPGNAFTARLTWRTGTNAFQDLTSGNKSVATLQGVTLGRTHAIDYQQPLAGQNVAADLYTTTATFTAATCA